MNIHNTPSHMTVYESLDQGTEEWLQTRLGLLTASEMNRIMTPTLKAASNDKERQHLYELLAQRISGYVEPHYMNDDMLRGHEDEIDAKILYAEHCGPVREVGFITNSKWGFTLGYSPDGLVDPDGLLECKSRRQKYQVQTIIENVLEAGGATIPAEYALQHQTGLLVAERQWIDFISYSGGLPMAVIRVHPDPVVQDAIINAAGEFEKRLASRLDQYREAMESGARLFPTERREIQSDIVI